MSKETQGIKSVIKSRIVADTYPYSLAFRDRHNKLTVLRAPKWREIPDEPTVTESDFISLPYFHPDNREEDHSLLSKHVAERELQKIEQGNVTLGLGIELEGSLYSENGNNLKPKYDGDKYTAATDEHPEKGASMIEVATGQLPDGRYPASAVEAAVSLAKAVMKGEKIADDRKGLFVVSSVPEGGNISQLTLTEHPYIQYFKPGPIRESPGASNIPNETMNIFDKVGIKDLFVYQATHIHVSNPKMEGSEFFDPRVAYAKGLLRTTQFEKALNMMLYNTRHYLGVDLAVKDVRAMVRKGSYTTHDGTLPDSSYEFFQKSQEAVAKGEIHSFSRHPATGQHGVLRIKEFGTTEGIDGASNPDLRLVLAKTFTDQMRDILAYEAVVATDGDETKVLPYLQETYGNLFNVVPLLKGKNNSFQQDLNFNEKGFHARVDGETYQDQYKQMRAIIRKLGKKYPAFEPQAAIVDHVLKHVAQPPKKDLSLEQFLDHTTGMKTGIVTDYKTEDHVEAVLVQADATRKQAEALLQVRDNDDLFDFVGMESKDKREKELTVVVYKSK